TRVSGGPQGRRDTGYTFPVLRRSCGPFSLRAFLQRAPLRPLVCVVLAAFVSLSATQTPATPLGRISFPTSGAATAQPLFVRGVLFLHSFEYDDAIEAFRQAQKIDPGFAMAYWGEALAYDQPLWLNESVDKARAVLARLGPAPAARQAKAPTA